MGNKIGPRRSPAQVEVEEVSRKRDHARPDIIYALILSYCLTREQLTGREPFFSNNPPFAE